MLTVQSRPFYLCSCFAHYALSRPSTACVASAAAAARHAPDTPQYGNLICGVLRGCLEMVQYRVDVRYVESVLHGDKTDVISVKLVEVIQDEIPPGE